MIKIYNSLSKIKEEFIPREPGKVSMYHCGPTVYDYVHIGNLRSFMLGDFIRRTFEYTGYKVTQVMNITDIGHLVSDGDEGDDKMTKALKREGKDITVENMLSAANFYADAFKEDLKALNLLTPQHIPRASEHIEGNIEIIQKLEEKGFTYTTSDGVYFDISKMSNYGALGGINLENEQESRLQENQEKRQQADFALWKFDEKQGWDSPWGQGFPGWHIECSAMSRAFLGDHFDIHTGGLDNLPIHHNNEIAQSTCATGTPFVNYWLHGAMLNFGGAKLSKSTGGNITLKNLADKNINPLAYRYMALQTHYHSPMNFTWEVLESAQTGLERIYREILTLRNTVVKPGVVDPVFQQEFIAKVTDDINIPQALAVFHTMMNADLPNEVKLATAYDFDKVFGLRFEEHQEEELFLEQEILDLLEKRKIAREERDFITSDFIRDQFISMGYKVSDIKGEQKISKLKKE
jgi:cysteinyl-tRNA synthetase